ncbi:TetR/AcrR family transcriptional regulator [Nonomuraea ferruginea]
MPLEEIARRAEVSIGTLYNRFPSRDDLVEAVFADRVAAVRELAERSLAADDAWEGFVAFLTGVCELQSVDLGYNDLAVRSVGGRTPARGGRVDAADRGAGPGGRDVAAGCDAGGHGVRDLGVAGTVRATFRTAPGAWRRHLALTLDGLRAGAAHPLPVPPMTTAQTEKALGGCDQGASAQGTRGRQRGG